MSGYRDGRLPPFAWISRAAAEALLNEFTGRERAMALSVYLALALTSSQQRRGTHDGIIATRGQIAELAGVSDRTVDAYSERMVKAGLLEVEQRRAGRQLPNVWTMLEPEQVQGEDGSPEPPSAEADVAPGRTGFAPLKEGEEVPPPDGGGTSPRASRQETDPDAIRLCRLLAGLMRQNDPRAKLPREGTANREGWIRQMRLLIADREGDVAEVEFVIRWCQADQFEAPNVLSPGKLRKRFTNLKLKAERQRAQGQHLSGVNPHAGMSASQRARAERTERRLARINQTNPEGAHDGYLPVGEDRRLGRATGSAQPAAEGRPGA